MGTEVKFITTRSPWRPLHAEEETCFIGINFYIVQEGTKRTVRSSMAEAFDVLGQGLVVRGDPFEWDKDDGPSPHLRTEAAEKLITDCLRKCEQVRKVPPRRIVAHKQSKYWGSEHPDHNEQRGFYAGIEQVFPRSQVDLVALTKSRIRLSREGKYPPIRGTHINLGDSVHLLYTMGYINRDRGKDHQEMGDEDRTPVRVIRRQLKVADPVSNLGSAACRLHRSGGNLPHRPVPQPTLGQGAQVDQADRPPSW